MICQTLERLEGDLFRALNGVLEPLVRAGAGSPGPWPTGLIVLETRGRKTGRVFNVPLLATLIGDLVVVVSTIRGRSRWVRNVAESRRVRYWMHGRAREATALVVAPGQVPAPSPAGGPLAGALASGLAPISLTLGMAFAILSPASAAASA